MDAVCYVVCTSVYDLFPVPPQDVLLIRCSPDWISQNHVLASCRAVLRSQGIRGLSRAPCMAVFLERLPLLLQEQYNYERVRNHDTTKGKKLKDALNSGGKNPGVIGCMFRNI